MNPPGFDVAVGGGGVVGAATARALAKRGPSVALLERGTLGRPIGSSGGGARIWHFAGYRNDEHLDHGMHALEGWRQLERETNRQILLHGEGGVSYGEGVEAQAELLRRSGRECELLLGEELNGRLPGLTLPRDEPVLFQRDAGVILSRAALAALLASARRAGAALTEHAQVRALTIDGPGVNVTADDDTIRADCAVVAAGPWSRQFLSMAGIDLDVHVTEQTIAGFGWKQSPPPTLIEFGQPDPYAQFDPEVGLKAGLHEPRGIDRRSRGALRSRARERRRAPYGVGSPALFTRHCPSCSDEDVSLHLDTG